MKLSEKIKHKTVKVGVIGLGYVGLPLALEFALKGIDVVGFDIDQKKIISLAKRKTYLKHISEKRIRKGIESGHFSATSDFSRLAQVDAIIICVPTPLDEHRQPDLSYIVSTAATVSRYLRKGQLVCLESTTYPGTTEEILLPMFKHPVEIINYKTMKRYRRTGKKKKFVVGKDFYLAFSPEREDPNNSSYSTSTIPKVVGGVTRECLHVAKALYDLIIVRTVPVSSTRVAEATKLLENIYRSVNIAMVNELKIVFDKMGFDIWEVIGAASTKPFGFQPFYPGPGLGGHCIPIDPFYLTWKAREYDVQTKFIELAGEVNTLMPQYVVAKTVAALNKKNKSLNGARVLILGAAYKKDVDDMRESPSLKLIEICSEHGAHVDYNDPYVPKLPETRKYNFGMRSVPLTPNKLKGYDVVILSTDHSVYDYRFINKHSRLIVDTRNAFHKNGIKSNKIVKA